jgi:hypothetical protein
MPEDFVEWPGVESWHLIQHKSGSLDDKELVVRHTRTRGALFRQDRYRRMDFHGAWSSWVYNNDNDSASNCANNCANNSDNSNNGGVDFL